MSWKPISTAPKDVSILLFCNSVSVTMYCGRYRYGQPYEPQPHEIVWRCDSSGRFSHPTHWMPLPEPPKKERK